MTRLSRSGKTASITATAVPRDSWLLALLLTLTVCLAFPAGRLRAEGTRIRLMSANITSGAAQSYDPGHGIRILKGLRPDVTMLQEFNYGSNSPSDARDFVDTTFGPGFVYYRESGELPNGVISKYPIKESGSWEDPPISNREFAWARLDIPGATDLWVVSVHFKAGNEGSSRDTRSDQARRLAALLRVKVPATDYLAIGGDFNTQNRAEPAINYLSAVVNTASPFPTDAESNGSTNFSRSKPYDWVLVNSSLSKREVPLEVGPLKFPSGLVFDSRSFPRLDLLPPIQSEDSAAAGMQHMGVARDFSIP